jgi:hypothetical protein
VAETIGANLVQPARNVGLESTSDYEEYIGYIEQERVEISRYRVSRTGKE